MLDETQSKQFQHENCVEWAWKCCMKCKTNNPVLLHWNINFSDTQHIYKCILIFCTPLSCNSSLKSHRSSHHRCSTKKLLLKISQYSQETPLSLIKLHVFIIFLKPITKLNRKLANDSFWNHEHKSM